MVKPSVVLTRALCEVVKGVVGTDVTYDRRENKAIVLTKKAKACQNYGSHGSQAGSVEVKGHWSDIPHDLQVMPFSVCHSLHPAACLGIVMCW